MRKTIVILIATFVFIAATPIRNDISSSIIWEDSFDENEKIKLTNWIEEVSSAVSETLGKYPFEIKLYIHRSENAGEPVPWAHTIRSKEQGVHFHVNPDFSLDEFKNDWTAQHEISHLSIPFVGKSNMWFSEGYASYMQYQVMWHQGVLTTAETNEKYKAKLKVNMPKYDSDDNFLEVSARLKKNYDYPAVYWGGACFFIQANTKLMKQKNISLNGVIRKYQQNGRNTDDNIEDVIVSLDRISDSKIFSELMETFINGSAREAVLTTEY